MLHIAKEIRDWNINREKARLELEKLKHENSTAYIELLQKSDEFEKDLEERVNNFLISQITDKLNDNQLKLKEITIPEDQSIPQEVEAVVVA